MSLDFDYLLLNLILLLIFCVAGNYVSKGGKYWGYAWACILSFTFVQGSRYARGNDYPHYLEVYKFDLEPGQRIYTWICDALKGIGINEYFSFYIYALVFSICLFVLLKRWDRYAKYIFPFALVALINFNEFMIRQAFSYSFVFLYANSLFNIHIPEKKHGKDKEKRKRERRGFFSRNIKHILLCLLFCVMSYGIHSANLLVIFGITFFYVLFKNPISWKITIPALIFCAYIFPKIFDLSFLDRYLQILGGMNDKFEAYTENSDRWFSEDAKKDKYARNPLVEMFEIMGNSVLLYIGDKLLRRRGQREHTAIYNLYIVGLLVMVAFRELELLHRIGSVMYQWWFVPLALILAYYFPVRDTREKAKEMKKALEQPASSTKKSKTGFPRKWVLFFLLFFLYEYMKYLFMRGENVKFLWDTPDSINIFQ